MLHERTVIVSAATSDAPHVDADAGVVVTALLDGALLDMDEATFFMGRETVTSIPEGCLDGASTCSSPSTEAPPARSASTTFLRQCSRSARPMTVCWTSQLVIEKAHVTRCL